MPFRAITPLSLYSSVVKGFLAKIDADFDKNFLQLHRE